MADVDEEQVEQKVAKILPPVKVLESHMDEGMPSAMSLVVPARCSFPFPDTLCNSFSLFVFYFKDCHLLLGGI